MKKCWKFVIVLLVGVGVALGAGAQSGWARPKSPFPSPDRHEDRENHDRGRDHRDHRDRGEHRGWYRGRHRGWYRGNDGRYRFSEDGRREMVRYFNEHRDDRWFRDDDAPRGFVVRYGAYLGPRYRRYCRPLPVVMLRELPPPPPRCHYFMFGGRVLLLNSGYRVQDFIQLSFNFGR